MKDIDQHKIATAYRPKLFNKYFLKNLQHKYNNNNVHLIVSLVCGPLS